MARLLVSTGEVSGDLQGSLLIRALYEEARERGVPLQVVALGGERMRRAGAELLADTTRLGAIGLWEALPMILPTLRLQARLRQWLRLNPLDGVVLIDYMGANVNLGLRLKRLHPEVPITYYIAPQEWAFRLGEGGTTRLIGFSDRILAIFPEEASFYAARGAAVTWVGHPLIDTLGQLPTRLQARQALGLPEAAPVLLLLPASRPQELRYLLPPMAAAVALLQQRLPALEVLLPAGLPGFEEPLARELAAAGARARVITAQEADRLKPELCAAADAALTKSGTANLELALRGVPQVAGYRVSRPTAFVARHLLRFNVPHISPVNLVLGERLVPELLQDQFNAAAIAETVA
ncbi:MAG: lipid-A-disaccharide synthase, partial [Cyanobacteriota bacterium]